jgi:hypothetical protein
MTTEPMLEDEFIGNVVKLVSHTKAPVAFSCLISAAFSLYLKTYPKPNWEYLSTELKRMYMGIQKDKEESERRHK